MAMIEVKNLVKTYKISEKEHGMIGYVKHLFHPKYKELTAVNDISFSIQEGELVGYIGENGAGKSTTIKMLTGLLTPTSGEVIVNGIGRIHEQSGFLSFHEGKIRNGRGYCHAAAASAENG